MLQLTKPQPPKYLTKDSCLQIAVYLHQYIVILSYKNTAHIDLLIAIHFELKAILEKVFKLAG